MNKQQQEIHLRVFQEKMSAIILKKGNDYATTDRLSNFKYAGAISGNSAAINCLNAIATKVARLGVLLNSENPPENESISDSIVDLSNYAVLLDMIVSEEASLRELPNMLQTFQEGYVYDPFDFQGIEWHCPIDATCRIVQKNGKPTLEVVSDVMS